MRVAITGHRPNRLGNEWGHRGPYSNYVLQKMEEIILLLKPTEMISGMALGSDTLWAEKAIKYRVSLIAAIPFKGQESKWPHYQQSKYHDILRDKIVTPVYVSEGGYSPEKMHIRDRFMVDKCQILVAVFGGDWKSGTGSTIKYAREKDKPIIFIDPEGWR